MSFQYVREIPLPQEILGAMSLSPELSAVKKRRDQDIKDVFTGKAKN